MLEAGAVSARDISQALRIREKDVYDHLEHVRRTMAGQGRKLTVQPFACLKCGYVFKERQRFTRPGRCPQCRETYLEEPLYVLE